MSLFDRLSEHGVVRENGDIVKCFDECTDDGIWVSDELRRCLIMPESVNYTFFTEQDRKEFVLHLFQSLVLGGEICQYEDTVSPYLTVTKSIYKDLIGVVRDAQTSTIRTTSQVYKVEAAAGSLNDLFPFRHPQNYCYLILDPLRKLCCFMYHASTSYY